MEHKLRARVAELRTLMTPPTHPPTPPPPQVEHKLRARVAELQEYRAAGLRTFEQVDEVEAAQEGKRKRGEREGWVGGWEGKGGGGVCVGGGGGRGGEVKAAQER